MRQTLGLLVARALEGSWRREPPFLELSQHELGDIASLLAASGAGALAWNRISRIPYLRDQMHWIVANHKREGAVSVSVAGKTCRSTDATTIELPDPPIDAIDKHIASLVSSPS
jgi:hypothetical protein